MLQKHRHIDSQAAKMGLRRCNRLVHPVWMSTYCTESHTPHMLSSHYTLGAAMQAGCMVEWMYDLRPVFEVHRGREWELMDLCFMTCFTGTLPFSVTPAHLWFILQILILFIRSWQPCIIHPSHSTLLLCLFWFFFLCLRTFPYTSPPLSPRMFSSLSHTFTSPVSLLFSSWLRGCSPRRCGSRRCDCCLNRTTLIFVCVHSPLCFALLERNWALCSVLLMNRSARKWEDSNTCWGQITTFIGMHQSSRDLFTYSLMQ